MHCCNQDFITLGELSSKLIDALLWMTSNLVLTKGSKFMKHALLILTVLGMGIAQTSGAAEGLYGTNYTVTRAKPIRTINNASITSNYASSQNIYSTKSGAHVAVSNNDEISRTITRLSNTAQKKQQELASLTSKVFYEQQKKFAGSIPDRFSAPAQAAAHASRVALSRSSGRCARYVRTALQAAGYSFKPNPSAYQYATRGTLANAGFTKISNSTPPQVGDVVVYDRSSKHPHGHIQIYDGSSWISDFRQNSISPYSGAYSYTTWRDSQYVDDASNRGIYLAMAE